MEWLSSATGAVASALAGASKAVRERPGTAIAVTNVLTAAFFVYIISEGKPVKYIKKKLFQAAMAAVPKSLVDKELAKVKRDIERDIIGHSLDGETLVQELPAKGWTRDEVVSTLAHYSAKDETKWKSGRISGCVYHGGDDLSSLMTEAFSRYALSNPLHPDVFPSLRKMEAEVVSMTLKLFNGGPTTVGTMTSGGTESILMALKAYRDHAKATRGVSEPELIAPVTAHAAFDKGCFYFGIKLVHLPVDPVTFKVSPAAVEAAITRNTIAVVVSAPNFPQGVIDPVEAVAALAARRGLPVHVDCCLGSFLIPFAEEVTGKAMPKFDFRVPGVTSISTDTHKFGFAPKGSSVIMYASDTFRHAQYFVAPEWTGGIYASPSIAGSRPGALIAACWATMVHIGRDGYRAAAAKILGAAQAVTEGIRTRVPELTLYGEPDLSVVCFGPKLGAGGAPSMNIYNVSDEMVARGWNLNVLQGPPCVHICITYANAEAAAASFVSDLEASVAAVKGAPAGKYKGGAGAIYGMAASIEDKSLVNEVAFGFLDTLYKADPPAPADA